MKWRDLVSQITGKDGSDDPERLKRIIADVETQKADAHTVLASLADKRTDALLEDDAKAIAALDQSAQRAYFTIEQSEVLLPRLQARLQEAESRNAEAGRKARADAAQAKATNTEKALRKDYNRLANELLTLVAAAAEAIAEVNAANKDLPVGYTPIEMPPALARGPTYFPEKVLSEKIVERWTTESGKLVNEEGVKNLGQGRGVLQGQTGNTPVIRKRFREVEFLPELRDVVERLDQLLVIPGLHAGEPPIWSGSPAYVDEAAEAIRAAANEKRSSTPKTITRTPRTRLEEI